MAGNEERNRETDEASPIASIARVGSVRNQCDQKYDILRFNSFASAGLLSEL